MDWNVNGVGWDGDGNVNGDGMDSWGLFFLLCGVRVWEGNTEASCAPSNIINWRKRHVSILANALETWREGLGTLGVCTQINSRRYLLGQQTVQQLLFE